MDWIKYDKKDQTTHPTIYDRYLVCRKDGKKHLEQWNGTSWAYNGPVITHYCVLTDPKK